MPFGSIFGALFFGGVCVLMAAALLGHPTLPGKLAGLFLALLGLSLAFGLVTRRSWARWGGFGCAGLIVLLGFRRLSHSSAIEDYVLLLAALVTALLLALPATGSLGAPNGSGRRGPGVAEAGGVIGFVGLLVVGLGMPQAPPQRAAAGGGALPVSATAAPLLWNDMDTGLELARASGKPVLATFVTSWCGYCNKMRKSWKEPAVRRRMENAIPVRIDVEDAAVRGPELARRYGIRGYPVQILIGPDGAILDRADGYLSASQLLRWLDGALPVETDNPARAGRTALR